MDDAMVLLSPGDKFISWPGESLAGAKVTFGQGYQGRRWLRPSMCRVALLDFILLDGESAVGNFGVGRPAVEAGKDGGDGFKAGKPETDAIDP